MGAFGSKEGGRTDFSIRFLFHKHFNLKYKDSSSKSAISKLRILIFA